MLIKMQRSLGNIVIVVAIYYYEAPFGILSSFGNFSWLGGSFLCYDINVC